MQIINHMENVKQKVIAKNEYNIVDMTTDQDITDNHCQTHKQFVQLCLNTPAVVQLHIAGVDLVAHHPHHVAVVSS